MQFCNNLKFDSRLNSLQFKKLLRAYVHIKNLCHKSKTLIKNYKGKLADNHKKLNLLNAC